MKEMLNTDELIQHMKDRGVRFDIIKEEEAKEFLTNNNYYMKLAAYRTNYQKYNEEIVDNKFMNLVRDLRNASAHNNCLINKIQAEVKGVPDKRIFDFVKELNCIGKSSISNNLRKSFMYNFIVLLYVYDKIVINISVKNNRYIELGALVNESMIRNKEYFVKNNIIKSQYVFVKKVIDKLNENAYTKIIIEKQ